jgi:hypothetical protein
MRLITRSDFDGLACAVLLEELGIVDEILYMHPKDIQDGKVQVTENDVLANVPFVPGCGLWFDHHSSEQERNRLMGRFKGACEMEASAARVIYRHYSGDAANAARLKPFDELVNAVDKADSGNYTRDDILNPQGWMLLAFIADPRTGLGYRHSYRVSNFELMKSLPGLLRTRRIEEILADPDIQDRVLAYRRDTERYRQFLLDTARVEGDAVVIDLRGKKDVPGGNRFLEYLLFPEQNVSIRLVDGKNNGFVMISIGHSIVNRSSRVDIGSLSLAHGGGGHRKVGTCQVPPDKADQVLAEVLAAIRAAATRAG